jgi:hypothetical protein
MYAGYSFQEILVMVSAIIASLGFLLAFLDLDPINRGGLIYIDWVRRRYRLSSGIWSIFPGMLLLPIHLTSLTKNEGWKTAIAIIALPISVLLFLSLISFLFAVGFIILTQVFNF